MDGYSNELFYKLTPLITAKIAQRIRTIVVTETCPVGKPGPGRNPGELRRTIAVVPYGTGHAVVANKRYARAVHDGDKARIIRPKTKKALMFDGAPMNHPWKYVTRPATKGNPFFQKGIDRFMGDLDNELADIFPEITEFGKDMLELSLKEAGLRVV